ncbi:unnamed protein product [Orchesella dallaii]|uniref:Uncharacterized protein n=1 Tax=Orchesella dallaii TaxID=48710 RepID=A0ABP1RCB3_9HEXA
MQSPPRPRNKKKILGVRRESTFPLALKQHHDHHSYMTHNQPDRLLPYTFSKVFLFTVFRRRLKGNCEQCWYIRNKTVSFSLANFFAKEELTFYNTRSNAEMILMIPIYLVGWDCEESRESKKERTMKTKKVY